MFENSTIAPHSINSWDADLETAVCEKCQWRFLLPRGAAPPHCPHCHAQSLAVLPGGLPEMPHPYPPELVVPFSLSDQALSGAVQEFASGIPYTPDDLSVARLQSRLARLYLPAWLVDGTVSAIWQAEAGFNYEVVSHQESYHQDGGGWKTREVKEGRVRWEKRLGRLCRTYHNLPAPAMEDATFLEKTLGSYRQDGAQTYAPEHLDGVITRLPDRSPQEAWDEAGISFQKTAEQECKQACAADHFREFHWKPQFDAANWTMMLLPAFTSYYLDDDNQPQPVLIHGQTGKVTGARKASMRRAKQMSLTFIAIGAILVLVGLILGVFTTLVPPLGILSALALLCGVACGAASLAPIGIAWDFNRKQAASIDAFGKRPGG